MGYVKKNEAKMGIGGGGEEALMSFGYIQISMIHRGIEAHTKEP